MSNVRVSMKLSAKLSSIAIGLSLLTFCCNALASLGDINEIKWYIAIEGAGLGVILGAFSWFTEKLGYITSLVIFVVLSAVGALFIEASFDTILLIIALQAIFAFWPMSICFLIMHLFKPKVNCNSNPSFKRDA